MRGLDESKIDSFGNYWSLGTDEYGKEILTKIKILNKEPINFLNISVKESLIKESYGTLADYLENHLDSWYGRLNEIREDIEDLGLDVDEINGEYIIVHAAEPDGEDVYCKITLGGTERTISLEKFEMV